MPRTFPPIEGQRHPHQALPPSLVEIVAGFSAGVVSTLAVHPFDVVKTRLQVDQDRKSPRVGGSIKIARDLLKYEGFGHGLYRGLTPNIVGNSVSWALYFMWYGNIKDMIQAYRGQGQKLQSMDYFAASSVSGVLTAVFTNPIWVIKTRMLSTARFVPGAYTNIWHGAKAIWKNEGIPGFYRGLVPSLFGVSHGAIQFMAYEQLKIWRAGIRAEGEEHTSRSTKRNDNSVGARIGDSLSNLTSSAAPIADLADSKQQGAVVTVTEQVSPTAKKSVEVELSNFDFLTLSAVSKMFAGSITYPYQVVRARLQVYDAATRYNGAMDVVRQVWRLEGVGGFYKGLGPNIVRVLPSTCVTFLVYENTKLYLPQFWSQRNGYGDEAEDK